MHRHRFGTPQVTHFWNLFRFPTVSLFPVAAAESFVAVVVAAGAEAVVLAAVGAVPTAAAVAEAVVVAAVGAVPTAAAVAEAVIGAAVGAVPTVAVSLAPFAGEQIPMPELLLTGSDRDLARPGRIVRCSDAM